MQRFYFFLFLFISTIFALSACNFNSSEVKKKEVTLTISAAASLTEVFDEISDIYEKENPTVTIQLNFGSSGVLQQQINQGAPVDLYISAAEDQFNYLAEKNIFHSDYQQKIATNRLVLITNKEEDNFISNFKDLLDPRVKQIAIGSPESVPAGAYAKQTLEHLNMFQTLTETDKLITAKDVRQVLHYVETNNVDAGIVYQTDAIKSDLVKIVSIAHVGDHDEIIYPVGVIKNTKNEQEAISFYNFITSEKVKKVFKKHGFLPIGRENN